MSWKRGLSSSAVGSVMAGLVFVIGALGIGAPVLAQEASASPSVDPMAPSFFTGNAPVTGACPITSGTRETVNGVEQVRGQGWGCLRWTTDDPRFSGVSTNVYNADDYKSANGTATGRLGGIIVGNERIVNAAGAWNGTWTNLHTESFNEVAGWFVGDGAYEGLTAYVVITDGSNTAKVWGFISPNDRLEALRTLPSLSSATASPAP